MYALLQRQKDDEAEAEAEPLAPTSNSKPSVSWRKEAKKAIEGAADIEEARRIQQKLHVLKQKADAKVQLFEHDMFEAEETIENAIEDVDDIDEARVIQRRLDLLKKKADTKVQHFEQSAEEDGLSYKGGDAVKCPDPDCDNSFDPEGEYCGGKCAGCKALYCSKCLVECGCGRLLCSDCRQTCCGCEEVWICKECDNVDTCECCGELVCANDDCCTAHGYGKYAIVICHNCEQN